MSGGFVVEAYRKEWLDDLLELEAGLWSPDREISARHLDWKYRDNPYLPGIEFLLAFDGARPVAATGLYGARWEAGSPRRTITAHCRADTFVAPSHRGRGVAALIIDAIGRHLDDRGFSHVFGTSPSVEIVGGSVRRGWSASEAMTIVVRPPTRGRWWRRPGRPPPWPHHLDRVAEDAGRGITVGTGPRADDMAALVAALPWDGHVRHERDAAYFGWRFENPLSEFRFLYAGVDRLEGYLVVQTHSIAERRTGVAIVDWEAVDDRVAGALLDEAVAGSGTEAMTASLDGASASRAAMLRARDFAAPGPGIHAAPRRLIAYRVDGAGPPDALSLGGRNLVDLADWDWREIYSDNY